MLVAKTITLLRLAEYHAIRQIILDKKILPVLTLVDFERLLGETGVFSDDDSPKANNMKFYTIKGKYPDWVVPDKKFDVTNQFIKVARRFLDGYYL